MTLLARFCALFLVFSLAACGSVGGHVVGIDNFSQVTPELFRGAQPTDDGFRTLAAMKVKTIINLRRDNDPYESRLVRELGMEYICVPHDSDSVTPDEVDQLVKVIAAAKGPVFVHCWVGRDRTGTAVAAYRMAVQGWTYDAAVKEMYEHGHYWMLFPKATQSLAHLTERATPAMVPQVVAAMESPKAGEGDAAKAVTAQRN